MTRPEKRQEKRAQEQAFRIKELEAKGFNLVGSEEYHKKRAIANRKRGYETPEDEKLDRKDCARGRRHHSLAILLTPSLQSWVLPSTSFFRRKENSRTYYRVFLKELWLLTRVLGR